MWPKQILALSANRKEQNASSEWALYVDKDGVFMTEDNNCDNPTNLTTTQSTGRSKFLLVLYQLCDPRRRAGVLHNPTRQEDEDKRCVLPTYHYASRKVKVYYGVSKLLRPSKVGSATRVQFSRLAFSPTILVKRSGGLQHRDVPLVSVSFATKIAAAVDCVVI